MMHQEEQEGFEAAGAAFGAQGQKVNTCTLVTGTPWCVSGSSFTHGESPQRTEEALPLVHGADGPSRTPCLQC